jgi:hypothetical protein
VRCTGGDDLRELTSIKLTHFVRGRQLLLSSVAGLAQVRDGYSAKLLFFVLISKKNSEISKRSQTRVGMIVILRLVIVATIGVS